MKKKYQKPVLEIETYSLDTSIASNCGIVVSNGPALGSYTQCSDYYDPFAMSDSVEDEISVASVHNVSFYADMPSVCDCYYTADGNRYWTS